MPALRGYHLREDGISLRLRFPLITMPLHPKYPVIHWWLKCLGAAICAYSNISFSLLVRNEGFV